MIPGRRPTLSRYAYQYAVQPKDVVLVISNSGRNASPIEVALEAKAMGLSVIVLTSLDMSKATTSRHPSGKKLYELGDHVLDNGGVLGDAAIDAPGFAHKVGPTSTMSGALILNLLSMEIIENLIAQGITPPTYVSQNTDGGTEHNEALAQNIVTVSVDPFDFSKKRNLTSTMAYFLTHEILVSHPRVVIGVCLFFTAYPNYLVARWPVWPCPAWSSSSPRE